MSEPFTFGIPLIARSGAEDWARVVTLLDLTLTSLRAQTRSDFQIIIAGHDRPDLTGTDERLRFLQADWPAEAVRPDNLDSGRKKQAINATVLAEGGGLLMFVDADDWIDTRLVETARAAIGDDAIGGIIETGFAADFRALRALPIPHPVIFDQGFDRLCGSSIVARLRPRHPLVIRRDPHRILHEHYRWREGAREQGVSIAHLDLVGSYVINTSQNHSEGHGPFAAWRRSLNRDVAREGSAMDDAFLARFGLDLQRVRAASSRFLTHDHDGIRPLDVTGETPWPP